jgi:hypothetical protein
MKPTGRINPLTKEEILQIEESDINFWDTKWEDLNINQKAEFCSLMKVDFLNKDNEHRLKRMYEYFQMKNTIEL